MTASSHKSRHEYANQILEKLLTCCDHLQNDFHLPNRIPSCYVDDLLDPSDAKAIYTAFPSKNEMLLLKDLREYKYVMMQMNRIHPILEEIIYAFQDQRIVSLISNITGLQQLLPDAELYAGGISMMDEGCYLNPHLDNSHDKDRSHYRVLNLLYYVSPDWQESYGGNLELWDQGIKRPCRTIHSKFNRLVLMATNKTSWHSVSKVRHAGQRCCINNYYFSPKSPNIQEYAHVTSFRGRPDEKLKSVILQTDTLLRNLAPRSLKNLIRKPQYYKK
jgi:Rps23 Pro-64 3,4-dihydroxylase Tpa1-like proline 4-hydroxylase